MGEDIEKNDSTSHCSGWLRAAGLRLQPTSLQSGEVVQMAVAAGDKTGISSGPVIRVERGPIAIEPIGNVSGLVSLRSYVAPGACGGPVVDHAMNVRGYIVAGTDNPDDPYSLAYPSSAWAPFVLGEKPGKLSKRAVRKR